MRCSRLMEKRILLQVSLLRPSHVYEHMSAPLMLCDYAGSASFFKGLRCLQTNLLPDSDSEETSARSHFLSQPLIGRQRMWSEARTVTTITPGVSWACLTGLTAGSSRRSKWTGQCACGNLAFPSLG